MISSMHFSLTINQKVGRSNKWWGPSQQIAQEKEMLQFSSSSAQLSCFGHSLYVVGLALTLLFGGWLRGAASAWKKKIGGGIFSSLADLPSSLNQRQSFRGKKEAGHKSPCRPQGGTPWFYKQFRLVAASDVKLGAVRSRNWGILTSRE